MAKALFGHVANGTDLRLVDEVRRLRARVTDLETQLVRLRSAHDELVASVTVDDDIRMLTLDDEPALT
ncbi:MAG: hypothetical protein AVDCRST_MAG07-519 [uncultured Frankineae bacterium]|uniref:Uncharacterized protein n=1 Tax=uncultured Frankineae bacterium TaxID=437475 RepID=A0A6J4KNA6_9ACTN|nr:MAG: hypothetical protein AVDCRST_MAG07-519 [uncultured Frankineae bacterium]